MKKVYTAGGIANCLIISREEIDIPFKEVPLPKMGLAALRRRLAEDNKMIGLLKNDIKKAASYRQAFLHTKDMLKEELE